MSCSLEMSRKVNKEVMKTLFWLQGILFMKVIILIEGTRLWHNMICLFKQNFIHQYKNKLQKKWTRI